MKVSQTIYISIQNVIINMTFSKSATYTVLTELLGVLFY